jgi:hypothetical protein
MTYGYGTGTDGSEGISTKWLLVYFGVAVVGLFVFFSTFVFPIKNLFRDQVSEHVTVISKGDNICVVDSKDHPRSISNCSYNIGDKLLIKYKQGVFQIDSHAKEN